ncbi:hypothetical protein MMC07_005683, partial [Pseudocyphellaria aurata]|nr:hypothetical protein [Pseudocyphellaria aurata]
GKRLFAAALAKFNAEHLAGLVTEAKSMLTAACQRQKRMTCSNNAGVKSKREEGPERKGGGEERIGKVVNSFARELKSGNPAKCIGSVYNGEYGRRPDIAGETGDCPVGTFLVSSPSDTTDGARTETSLLPHDHSACSQPYTAKEAQSDLLLRDPTFSGPLILAEKPRLQLTSTALLQPDTVYVLMVPERESARSTKDEGFPKGSILDLIRQQARLKGASKLADVTRLSGLTDGKDSLLCNPHQEEVSTVLAVLQSIAPASSQVYLMLQPQLPLTLAHRAFGVFCDVFYGQLQMTTDSDGAKLVLDSSGKVLLEHLVDVQPLSQPAEQELIALCERIMHKEQTEVRAFRLPTLTAPGLMHAWHVQEGRGFFPGEISRLQNVNVASKLELILDQSPIESLGFVGRQGQGGMDLALTLDQVWRACGGMNTVPQQLLVAVACQSQPAVIALQALLMCVEAKNEACSTSSLPDFEAGYLAGSYWSTQGG